MQTKIVPFSEIKLKADGSGSVAGYASTFGNLDSYGDTVMPGAYQGTIAAFLKDGFMALAHDWGNDVGTFSQAYEDDKGLFIVGDFFSDPASQAARVKVKERLDREKSVGLSIGYEAVAWEFRTKAGPDGAADGAGERIRVLKEIKLYEVSLVTVPADKFATVTAAKSDMRLADHEALVRAQVPELVGRWRSLASDAEGKIGAALSAARRERLTGLSGVLRGGADELDALLEETKPKSTDDEMQKAGRLLYAAFLRDQARQLGVAV